MPTIRSFAFLLVLAGLFVLTCLGQTAPSNSSTATAGSVHTTDDPEVLRETQLTIDAPGYSGVVWWIPFEFWERSAEKEGRSVEQTRKTFQALKDYTIVGVLTAKVSSLGSFEYVSPADLQKTISIRDAGGIDYPAIPEVSGDAKTLADMLRPVLGNAMGRAGENFALLFFPARDKAGHQIADSVSKGQFSVVMKNLLGEPETIYLWRTPLSAFLPPHYCPLGKERVHANWEYCPWHGVKLSEKP